MGFSGAVKIGDVNDFIAPSQACVVALDGNKISSADAAAEVGFTGIGDLVLFLIRSDNILPALPIYLIVSTHLHLTRHVRAAGLSAAAAARLDGPLLAGAPGAVTGRACSHQRSW